MREREGMLCSAPSGGRGTKAEKKEEADAETIHADHIGCAEGLAPGDVDPVSDGQSGGSDSIVERACPGIWDRAFLGPHCAGAADGRRDSGHPKGMRNFHQSEENLFSA